MKPILIVETNFIVGLVLGRDGAHADAMEALLERGRRGEVEIVIPAFSLLEANTVLRSIEKDRNRLRDSLIDKEREMRRNRHESEAAGSLTLFRTELLGLAQRSRSRFRARLGQMLRLAVVAPLNE